MYVMIDQVRMHDRLDANHAELRAGISAAAAAGASLVVFPECATTGFHRRLREVYDATAVGAIIDDLQARCEASGVAAVVGTPWPGPDGSVYNAALVLRPGMPRLVAPKGSREPPECEFQSLLSEQTELLRARRAGGHERRHLRLARRDAVEPISHGMLTVPLRE